MTANNNDKIPIGKYKKLRAIGEDYSNFINVKFKEGVEDNIKSGDIITLDMIEPYESLAVCKVAEYLDSNLSPEYIENNQWSKQYAKEIVDLVHEAEDADED